MLMLTSHHAMLVKSSAIWFSSFAQASTHAALRGSGSKKIPFDIWNASLLLPISVCHFTDVSD